MTKEEALEIWLPVIKMGVESMPECSEALNMAIEALEQEPCNDTISRQAVLALAKEECDTAIIPYRKFIKDVNALPPVTPQYTDAEIQKMQELEQESKIKVLDDMEAAKRLGMVDVYAASAWLEFIKDLKILGLRVCEVTESENNKE